MSDFLDQLRSRQRKWYIQPLDPMSAEEIYRMTKEKERICPSETVGCPKRPEIDSTRKLAETDWKTIKSLVEKIPTEVINAGKTDFGLNFYIYIKEWNEDKPHYRFATTDHLRKENALQYNNDRPKQPKPDSKSKANLKKVSSKPKALPTFVLKTNAMNDDGYGKKETPQEKAETKPLEKIPLKRFKLSSLYRISTHQTLALRFLVEELTKINETTEPLPDLKVGPGETESAYAVPASVVLEMKVKAKHRFLHFGIWKKNDKGEYKEIERYPRIVK